MELSTLDKDRARFHLGYTSYAGIDAGDVAQLEEAVQDIRSDYSLCRIIEQLDICDDAWESSKATREAFRFDVRESYAGDINRTILRDTTGNVKRWWEIYLWETDQLANLLWTPNYRQPDIQRYRYQRAAAAFVRAIPGVADTSVSSRRLEFQQLAGSFGF